MKKLVCILSFLFLASLLRSQSTSVPSGYTFCDWDKITVKKEYTPIAADTAIIFVSTRTYFPDKEFYLGYDYDTSNTIHCFTIYFHNNKWILVPRKNLEEAIASSPKSKNAAVYVEGFGKTFPGAIDRATRLTRTYNLLTIYFDWPTRNPEIKLRKNYRSTKAYSKLADKPFAYFLNELYRLKKENKAEYQNLTLFMHSMGNLLMRGAIQKNYLNLKDTLFTSIILNAACVPQRHHRNWVEKLNATKGVYIMRNNNDKTLNGAKLISLQRQLGERPRGPYAKNALYINYSAVLGEEHNYFLFTYMLKRFPEIRNIYATIFDGKVPVFDDEKKFLKLPRLRAVELIAPQPANGRDIGISIQAN